MPSRRLLRLAVRGVRGGGLRRGAGRARAGRAGADEEKAVVGTREYGHGDPTDEEQRLLWLINRARMDPVGEGLRIFSDYGDPAITGSSTISSR